LGFDIDDKAVKRAGLDYWPYVFVKCHESWEDFYEFFKQQEGPKRLVGFSKKGANVHTEVGAYRPGDWLLFGRCLFYKLHLHVHPKHTLTINIPQPAWQPCTRRASEA
jgi:tRNA(Leu) C34 or U34 (ribose-2'-O)-methylase TrmL